MMIKRTIFAIPPVLFFVLNLFLFVPFALYQGNIEEFDVAFKSVLIQFIFPAAALFLALIAFSLLFRQKYHQRFISNIFALGLLVWIQSNLLVWKYGLLTGQRIDWKKHIWSGWIDGLLWVVVLVLALILFKPFSKIAAFGSMLLILLQAISLVYTSIQKPAIWQSKAKWKEALEPPQEVFKFSAQQNVIQFVLDSFQSDFFREIINQEPERYGRALEGFTYFEEATGSFPSTQMAVPAILSGQIYKNDIPTHDFISQVNQGKTIGNVLFSHGYEVDLVVGDIYTKKASCSSHYSISVPYGVTKTLYEKTNAAQVLDLVLFRSAPQFLKKLIYHNELWLFQRLFSGTLKKMRFRLFSHRAFLDDLIQRMSLIRSRPVYKYIHLQTVHPPLVVNEHCELTKNIPVNRRNSIIQAKCALDQFIKFLDQLRAAGVYDSSLIILQADHGTVGKIKMTTKEKLPDDVPDRYLGDLPRIASLAVPLLAVKPPSSHGQLRVSQAEVELTDIPATICSFLKVNGIFSGRSVFEIDPNETRERKFYFYDWNTTNWDNEYFDYIDEFTIKGSAFHKSSWHYVLTYHSPNTSYKTDKVIFGTPQSNTFKRFGWAGNRRNTKGGYTYNWAIGNRSAVYLSLPKNEAVILIAHIKSFPFSSPQIVIVKVDGKEVGKWELRAPWNLVYKSLVIPPDEKRPEASLIEFSFSQYRKSDIGSARVSVLFESISFQRKKS
jgi:hypothetical protein